MMDFAGAAIDKPVFCNLSLTIEDRDGGYALSSVTVTEGDARIKISFGEPRNLRDVLRPRAVTELQRFLDGVDRPTGIWSFPGDRIVLQDLILSDPRLVVSRSGQEGVARLFVVRFQRFFGQVLGLFDTSVTIANPLRTQLDELAFRTIERAIMPLFNIAGYLESHDLDETDIGRDKLLELLGDLRHRINDLHLHYLVLSHHLAGHDTGAQSRLSRNLMQMIENKALAEED